MNIYFYSVVITKRVDICAAAMKHIGKTDYVINEGFFYFIPLYTTVLFLVNFRTLKSIWEGTSSTTMNLLGSISRTISITSIVWSTRTVWNSSRHLSINRKMSNLLSSKRQIHFISSNIRTGSRSLNRTSIFWKLSKSTMMPNKYLVYMILEIQVPYSEYAYIVDDGWFGKRLLCHIDIG